MADLFQDYFSFGFCGSLSGHAPAQAIPGKMTLNDGAANANATTSRRMDTMTTAQSTSELPAPAPVRVQPVVGPHVEWEIVLSGGHTDIFVIVSAPENATDAELQSLAETEAMAKTYIWSKRLVRPNARTERRGPATLEPLKPL